MDVDYSNNLYFVEHIKSIQDEIIEIEPFSFHSSNLKNNNATPKDTEINSFKFQQNINLANDLVKIICIRFYLHNLLEEYFMNDFEKDSNIFIINNIFDLYDYQIIYKYYHKWKIKENNVDEIINNYRNFWILYLQKLLIYVIPPFLLSIHVIVISIFVDSKTMNYIPDHNDL